MYSWLVWSGVALVIIGYTFLAGSQNIGNKLPLQQYCKRTLSFFSKTGRKILVRIVRQGRIPKHIAFIMDGNRRYARKHNQIASSGHVSGFKKLSNVLEWCNELGIENVSVFAFAINNFNRSTEEVAALMGLAKEKLRELASKSELVRSYEVQICVVGNRSLLAEDVREAAEFAEESTKHNKGMRLNICFPYSATDEISTAVRRITEDVAAGKLEVSEIDEQALEKRLHIPGPDLDILVRTSGQIRFSNYMLWQSAKMAYIRFVNVHWPDFTFFQMFCILVSWQMAYNDIKERKSLSNIGQ